MSQAGREGERGLLEAKVRSKAVGSEVRNNNGGNNRQNSRDYYYIIVIVIIEGGQGKEEEDESDRKRAVRMEIRTSSSLASSTLEQKTWSEWATPTTALLPQTNYFSSSTTSHYKRDIHVQSSPRVRAGQCWRRGFTFKPRSPEQPFQLRK